MPVRQQRTAPFRSSSLTYAQTSRPRVPVPKVFGLDIGFPTCAQSTILACPSELVLSSRQPTHASIPHTTLVPYVSRCQSPPKWSIYLCCTTPPFAGELRARWAHDSIPQATVSAEMLKSLRTFICPPSQNLYIGLTSLGRGWVEGTQDDVRPSSLVTSSSAVLFCPAVLSK
ncbi:hypothetical protein LZ30DRAFT_710415 [Colletotrichum cereale]|nr:hypothetical protein LZ30DRAFT_710415 [Colletotrichum cereale]